MIKGMKIGIAGLGYIGKRHLAQFRALGLETFTADPVMTPGEAALLGSAGHFSSLTEMLEKALPDAVSICLPTFMHRDSALEAFAHGAHVLMEKPFALTLEEIDTMISAANASGCMVMVAHVCRFMAQNAMARELIEGGKLGKPVFLNAWRNSATPSWSAKNWMGDRKASGGTVMDLQIHEIDLACWFFGSVKDVAMVHRQSEKFFGSGFYHVASSLSFENGAAALLEAGQLMPEGYPLTSGYRLIFEGGALEFAQTDNGAAMKLYEKGKMTDLTSDYAARQNGTDPYLAEIRHFADCLESGGEFMISAQDARTAVENVLKLAENEILPLC